jgi:hypothetical protein
VAGVPSPGVGAEAPATRQSATEAAGAAEASVRASEVPARVAEHVHAAEPVRTVEVAGGAAAAAPAPAAPTTSAGASRKRKRAFSSLR